MLEINLKELRTKLRLVIQQVEAGEEIRITRRGKRWLASCRPRFKRHRRCLI